MADKRAIDKLKEAFCVDNVSRYIIKKEGVVILEIYWKPLTGRGNLRSKYKAKCSEF